MRKPDYLNYVEFDPFTGASGRTIWEFFIACHDGNLPIVKSLLAAYPRLKQSEIHYHPPLHFAARENRVEVVEYLLDQGASPFCGGFTYQNLRSLLEQRNQAAVLRLLDAKISNSHLLTPEGEQLAEWIRERRVAPVREILSRRPEVVHYGDRQGTLPIHWAVMTRQIPVIDLLLEHGANIDARRPDGAKAIYLTNGDYNYRGWRDVPDNTIRPHLVLIGYLIAKGAEYDIWTAARLGDLERVQQELQRDPELLNQLPTYSGFYNSAPLRNAVRHAHYGVAKFLLDQGADPNLPELVAPHGAILRDAISVEHWDLVRLLLERGANPNSLVDSSGNCVWAAKDAPEDIRQLLADKGGKLGLEMAFYDRNYEYVESELGQDPNIPIPESLPLEDRRMVEIILRHQPNILARYFLPVEIPLDQANWLVANGLNSSYPDWLGVTPLHQCAKNGNIALAQFCLDHGASMQSIDDHYRQTPLEWALRHSQTTFATHFG